MRRSRSKESVRRADDLDELIGADKPLSIEELMPGVKHFAELKVCGSPVQIQQFISSAEAVVGGRVASPLWVYELGRSADGEFQAVALVTRDPRGCQDLLDAMRTKVQTERHYSADYPELLLMMSLNRFGPDPLDTQRVVEWLHFHAAGRIDAVERKLSDEEWLDLVENQTNAFMDVATNVREIEFAVFYTPWSGESPHPEASPVTRLRSKSGQLNHLGILRFDLLAVTTKEALDSVEDLVYQKRTGFGKVYRRSVKLAVKGEEQIMLAMFSARASKRSTANPANLLRSNAEALAQMHGAAVMMRSIRWSWHMGQGLQLANQGELEIWSDNELVFLDKCARQHNDNEEHVTDATFVHAMMVFVGQAMTSVLGRGGVQGVHDLDLPDEMAKHILKFVEK